MSLLRLILAGMMAAGCAAYAEEQTPTDTQRPTESPLKFPAVPTYSGWAYSLSAGSVSFDAQAAAQEGVDDTGFIVGFDAEYMRQDQPWSGVLGFGWVGYSDNQKIVATTVGTGTGNRGDVSTQSSDASAVELHGEYGLRRRFGANNGGFFIARGGYLLNILSERAISNCTDCPSQDIDIDGGLYGVTGVGVNGGQTFSLGLTYKKFFTGDFDRAINLELRWKAF